MEIPVSDALRKRSEATMDITAKVLDLLQSLEDPALPADRYAELQVKLDGYKAMLAPTKDLWKA